MRVSFEERAKQELIRCVKKEFIFSKKNEEIQCEDCKDYIWDEDVWAINLPDVMGNICAHYICLQCAPTIDALHMTPLGVRGKGVVQQRWNKTSELMPEDRRIIYTNLDGKPRLASHHKGLDGENFWLLSNGDEMNEKDVEYWHPLPPPPIKEK